MSAFKRYQSKVFWNQMHELDLGNAPINEESLDSSRETADGANITVIRRDKNANQSKRALNKSQSEVGENEEKEKEKRPSGRPYSPVSQGQRSQDSGFSDSDRSECSDSDVQTRQKRSRRRGRARKIDNSLCNPALTSTPKQDCNPMERDISKTRWDLSQLESVEEGTAELSIIENSEEESIRDFLFTEDPPGEDSSPTSSWSQGETPRLADKTLYSHSSSRTGQENSLNRLAPVRAWLCQLAREEEDESGTYVLHKSLPRLASLQDRLQNMSPTSSSTAAATKLLDRAAKFDQHFEQVKRKLLQLNNSRIERELVQSIEDDAYAFLTALGAPPPRRIHLNSLQSTMQQLNHMKMDIEAALEPRLDFYIERVVRSLEECETEERSGLRGSIAALSALGSAGVRAGRSIARCYGVRNLLSLVLTPNSSSELRISCLRALACVCSCPESIEALIRDDGAEVLADILASRSQTESEKTEAVALIVQISAPWSNCLGVAHLAPFADSLVRDLTELATKTNCAQTLLLSAAALNYLSTNRKFVQPIFEHDSVRILLRCVKKSTGENVCLKEQVAALIGELAREPSNFKYLAKARASVALVSFLRMRPANLEDTSRRLQVTAEAALTRMCVDPEIARQVVALGATDCLPGYENKEEEKKEKVKEEFIRCSSSLRLARREAAEQIHVAKSVDQFTF